jgi:uncharacterized protein YoxC
MSDWDTMKFTDWLRLLILVAFFGQFILIGTLVIILGKHMKIARAWLDIIKQNLALDTHTTKEVSEKVNRVEEKADARMEEIRAVIQDEGRSQRRLNEIRDVIRHEVGTILETEIKAVIAQCVSVHTAVDRVEDEQKKVREERENEANKQ